MKVEVFEGSIKKRYRYVELLYTVGELTGKLNCFWKKVFNANDRAGKGTFYYFPVGQGYEDGDGRE